MIYNLPFKRHPVQAFGSIDRLGSAPALFMDSASVNPRHKYGGASSNGKLDAAFGRSSCAPIGRADSGEMLEADAPVANR